MARQTENESKVTVSATIYKWQKLWLDDNRNLNFSAWLREELDNFIIRRENLQTILEDNEKTTR